MPNNHKLDTRAIMNMRLPGATAGCAGAIRFVLSVLAKSPDAVSKGLFYELRGSLRDRLIECGVPPGLVPEFTAIVQQLGVARLYGKGRSTVWHLMDVTFAAELVQEPWITKAFEAYFERNDLFDQVRLLKKRVEGLEIQVAGSGLTDVSVAEPEPEPEPESHVDPLQVLKDFFVRMFRDRQNPERGEGLFIGGKIGRLYKESFELELTEAVDRLVEVQFLAKNERFPTLVWRGHMFPENPAEVHALKVVGR